MSSFSLPIRSGLIALALVATAALAGCTGLTPVYGDRGAAQAMALNFAAPNSELEQLVYQDLTRRFSTSTAPDAPLVTISVSSAAQALAQSASADPGVNELMTATGVIKITRNGQPVLNAVRQATAQYTSDSQVLADNSAATAAAQQAAHALAETLELTIISALAPNTPAQ